MSYFVNVHNIKSNETKSICADLFESIIGAIALECVWNLKTLDNIVGNLLDFKEYQKLYNKTPEYIFDYIDVMYYCLCKNLLESVIKFSEKAY